jgi:hypothetical protein
MDNWDNGGLSVSIVRLWTQVTDLAFMSNSWADLYIVFLDHTVDVGCPRKCKVVLAKYNQEYQIKLYTFFEI